MILAASTGGQILGSIGTAGLGLILATVFILGTRPNSKHPLNANRALTVCLVAGVVWMSAGQIWGVPDDLLSKALTALMKTQALGDIGLGAVSIVLVVIAYMVNLKARTAGYLGITMASAFSLTGGGWAMLTASIADMATGWAS
ncbi:hypothetical protein [Streptomyces marianii]|uniref:Uncharacterized protein n=1 Tax=Streptomyces marianii TaxID=1817406 RepID=A0A5R9EAG4_9ACTN|nr:hypothetical protein [Streptomyces marianii]TLQ45772.1 hypothetical protein FEF34_24740 [Streptomyces marianii]